MSSKLQTSPVATLELFSLKSLDDFEPTQT